MISPTDQVRTTFIHSARSYSLRLTDGIDVFTVRHLQVELVFLEFDMYILSRSSDSRCLTYGVQYQAASTCTYPRTQKTSY